MVRPDTRTRSAHEGNRGPGVPALGISLCLHGIVLAGIVSFWGTNPPQPLPVIAVEIVNAADLVTRGRKTTGEQSRQSKSMMMEGTGADQPDGNHMRDEKALVVEIPSENTDPPVERKGNPKQLSGPETPRNPANRLAQKRPPLHIEPPPATASTAPAAASIDRSPEIAPLAQSIPRAPKPQAKIDVPTKSPPPKRPTPDGRKTLTKSNTPLTGAPLPRTTPLVQKSLAKINATFRSRPRPGKKPVPPYLSAGTKSVPSQIKEAPVELENSARKRIAPEKPNDLVHADAARATAQMQQAAARKLMKSKNIAALPTTGRRDGFVAHPEASANPRYAGNGLSNAPPPYPYLARRRGQQGRVVLRVQVAANGDATMVGVHRSSGYRLLDDAALTAVRKWRFAPASRGESPIAGSVNIPISFKLTDQ